MTSTVRAYRLYLHILNQLFIKLLHRIMHRKYVKHQTVHVIFFDREAIRQYTTGADCVSTLR